METIAWCLPILALLGWLNQAGWDGRGMWHASGRREKSTGIWWENLKERDHLEEMFVDGKDNSEMYFGEMQWEGVDWIHLVQNRDKWLAVVSTVMNIWVFILLPEQHKIVDFVDWFLFSSATCLGCLFRPSSSGNAGSQKSKQGRGLSLQTVGKILWLLLFRKRNYKRHFSVLLIIIIKFHLH